MTRVPTLSILVVVALSLAAPARAESYSTFVSAFGTNNPTCSRDLPCRTFQQAHDVTTSGGEITVLDPGEYSPVIIDRAIAITNDGVGEAGIVIPPGMSGITVTAVTSAKVSVRGLTLTGTGMGPAIGIRFTDGASLSVENCVIRRIAGTSFPSGLGIFFTPSAAASLFVSNTLITQIESVGIFMRPRDGGASRAVLNRVEVYDSLDAIMLDAIPGNTMDATVTDSIAANNTGRGLLLSAGTSVMATRFVAANNDVGIDVNPGSVARFSRSTVMGNTFAWVRHVGGGTLVSYVDNYADGNHDDGRVRPSTTGRK